MQKTLRTFRLAGQPHQLPFVEALLHAQGFVFEPLPFYAQGMLLTSEPLPLGSSLAARFGYLYIQDASSMLPSLALHQGIGRFTGQGEPPLRCMLDMCASPGGKTGLLAQLAGPRSLVLGNEPSVKRLGTLRRNLEGLNLLNTATISFNGETLPLPSAGLAPVLGTNCARQADQGREAEPLPARDASAPYAHGGPLTEVAPLATGDALFSGFDHILLDPPCSGWGTAEKHPQVLTLWQGDKVKPLIGLQRLLLREAARLLKPGGCLSYSTCTVNPQENEEQIRWALTELDAELGGGALELVPLEPFPGFTFDEPLLDCAGTLRVSADSALGQGFYIALLRKSIGAGPLAQTGKAARQVKNIQGKHPAPEAALAAQYLQNRMLESPLADPTLLPPGSLLLRQGQLSFMHAAGLQALPATFPWRGFPLGKAPSATAAPRLDTGVRGLMPDPDKARAMGADILQVEDLQPIQALLSGQSLRLPASAPEVGLYYKELPLCRLKAKNGRVFI